MKEEEVKTEAQVVEALSTQIDPLTARFLKSYKTKIISRLAENDTYELSLNQNNRYFY